LLKPQDDAAQPLPQVRQPLVAVHQRQDGHNLRGDGDVVAGDAGDAVGAVGKMGHQLPQRARSLRQRLVGLPGLQTDDDVAQRPVVDVHHPVPEDGVGVNVQAGDLRAELRQLLVGHLHFVENAGINGRRQQVVGHADRMDVAGQVEVEVLHGHHLGVATTGRAALDAEGSAPWTAGGCR
jgi:hypothetical protein